MEPRPPKPPRSTPRQPQQPSWDPTGQPTSPNQPPAGNRRDGGYPGSNRYPEYPPYEQQPPAYPQQPGQGYPAPQQPGYGQQLPADPYAGYQRPVYPPANPQGNFPAGYPGYTPDPNAGYGGQQVYPPQPGAYPPANQTGQLPVQAPTGRSGGWIAPLPDEDLSSIQPSTYGGGYGGGGFSGDPRSGRPVPGPNRQTQIIAALAIGGLALMILAIVIGFIVFGGDDDNPNDTPTPVSGAVTDVTPTTDAAQAQTPTVPAGETAVTPTVAVTETATETTEGTEPTAAPTEAPADTGDQGANSSSGVFEGTGSDLLPSAEELPVPNFVMTTSDADERYNRAEVAGSLGDTDGSVEQELRDNGFDSNWRREFVVDPESSNPAETSVFFVSISIFRSAEGAANSLPLYLDSAVAIGYTEVDGDSFGESSASLESSDEGTAYVIYVLQSNVIFRFYGYSGGGDPTADVVALAQTVLGKMP